MASPVDTKVNEIAVSNEEEEEHFSYAVQLVTAGSLPMVLLSAFRLGLFEIIAGAGPGTQLSASQIVAKLSTENPEAVLMVDRMLHLLACHSVLTCTTSVVEEEGKSGISRVYGLAPVAKYFLPNPHLGGASFGSGLIMFQDQVLTASWHAMDDAVLKGGVPFNTVYGTNLFEYLGKYSNFNQVFNQALADYSTVIISRILDSSYKGFENLKSLVDVGGGLGINISKITSKYPSIKGINFDLPHVIQHASAYSGVQHSEGDMFESVPNGDAIFMKGILHDWDDEHCLKLLKNCYSSLPYTGKVIVVEVIMPINFTASTSAKASCQLDMNIMIHTPGGKERTEQEFLALATAAGFKGIKKECFVCNMWDIEFYK